MSTASHIEGHCLCGAVEFLITREPVWCGHCHCEDCRRCVGSAVATFIGCDKTFFSLIKGELKTFESSPGVTRSFCANCGTPVAYESEKLPGEIHILLGALSHPEAYTPQLEVFCKEKLPWLDLRVDGPAFDTLPE